MDQILVAKEKDVVLVLWARVKEDQVLVRLEDFKVLVPWVGCCLVVVPVLSLQSALSS